MESNGGWSETILFQACSDLFRFDDSRGRRCSGSTTATTTASGECCGQVDFVLQRSQRINVGEVSRPATKWDCDYGPFQGAESIGWRAGHDRCAASRGED